MCKIYKCFFGIIFFLINSFYSFGQSDILFNHLTTEDGLTTNNVRAFIQDYQGFMWLGTENGLHRYDGYEFKIYQNKATDSSSIYGNFIMSFFEDSEQRLWVGTLDGGLSLYNR